MAYSDLLIWQYRGKPKAKATSKLFDDVIASSFKDVLSVIDVLNIDKAAGVNLDMVGRHIGQSRVLNDYAPIGYFGFRGGFGAMPFGRRGKGGGKFYRYRDPIRQSVRLGDDDFRFLIKAKIIHNYQTATLPNLIDAVKFIFGDDCVITDNYDMTVTVQIPIEYKTFFKQFAVENLDILPRSAGVKYNIIWGDVPITKYFGFKDVPNALGFSKSGLGGAKFYTIEKED